MAEINNVNQSVGGEASVPLRDKREVDPDPKAIQVFTDGATRSHAKHVDHKGKLDEGQTIWNKTKEVYPGRDVSVIETVLKENNINDPSAISTEKYIRFPGEIVNKETGKSSFAFPKDAGDVTKELNEAKAEENTALAQAQNISAKQDSMQVASSAGAEALTAKTEEIKLAANKEAIKNDSVNDVAMYSPEELAAEKAAQDSTKLPEVVPTKLSYNF